MAKSLVALERCGVSHLVVAGGVGANKELRTRLTHASDRKGFKVYFPPPEFCTDNGAMIAFAAALRLQQGEGRRVKGEGWSFSVRPRWDLATG